MIVRRADVRKVLEGLTYDRMGFARLDDPADITRLAKFAHRANAVVEWALADYLSRGCPHDTPETAKLGLALLGAAPEAFQFEGCDCHMPEGINCPHFEGWHAQLMNVIAQGEVGQA